MLCLTVLRSCVSESSQECCSSDHSLLFWCVALLNPPTMGSSSCFLCLGLKASGEIIHLCKLLSRICSAVLQRMGPCPRSDGRWRSYSPRQESQDRWSPIREKKYISLSPHLPGEDSHVISDRYNFHQQETVSMIWRALGLQRLSNMANVHAYTGTKYCLINL